MVNVNTHTPLDMELGIFHNDADEMFLRRLSVYATIRSGDLKNDVSNRRTDGHKSLADLFKVWDIKEQAELDCDENDHDHPLPEQLEMREHELLVKGFEIDSRIAPGFRYNVRYIGTNEYLFNGEARRLNSIGLGYGRRMTFQGNSLNFNDCFFWSDSIPNGYALNIQALKEGDVFIIVDADQQEVGSVEVQKVDFPQIEKDTFIEDNAVVKNVKARFACFLKLFNQHSQNLMNVNTQDFEVVEGTAQLVKEKGSKEAVVRCINDVHFSSIGNCTLHSDP